MIQPQIPMSDILARVPGFAQIDQSVRAPEPNLAQLESHLQTGTYLSWSEAFNARVKCAEINTWRCTDTQVGVLAYYFDGVFVALSFQPARKERPHFVWVSREAAGQMRNFIHSLADGGEGPDVEVLDPEGKVSADWLRVRPSR